MLKFFFWVLLAANAGLAAYQFGYFDPMMSSSREPARMKNQFNTNHLRLVTPPVEREPAPQQAAAPAVEPEPKKEPPPEPESAPVAAKPSVPVLACLEIGNFNADDAKRFEAQLNSLKLGAQASQRAAEGSVSYVVYIPPQINREGTDKKAEELRQLGVTDFFIIQDDPALQGGISLGVFKREEAARTHLANLILQGVRSARVGKRSSATVFQLRDVDADERKAFEKMREAFPKQKIRNCPPA